MWLLTISWKYLLKEEFVSRKDVVFQVVSENSKFNKNCEVTERTNFNEKILKQFFLTKDHFVKKIENSK